MRTEPLTDATSDFACLVFRFLAIRETASCPVRKLTSPRDDQSASCPVHELAIRELSSYRLHDGRQLLEGWNRRLYNGHSSYLALFSISHYKHHDLCCLLLFCGVYTYSFVVSSVLLCDRRMWLVCPMTMLPFHCQQQWSDSVSRLSWQRGSPTAFSTLWSSVCYSKSKETWFHNYTIHECTIKYSVKTYSNVTKVLVQEIYNCKSACVSACKLDTLLPKISKTVRHCRTIFWWLVISYFY